MLKRPADLGECASARVSRRLPNRAAPAKSSTGCCSLPDSDLTGIEIAEGMVGLVRWPDDEGQRAP
jgi:hypothetical protein